MHREGSMHESRPEQQQIKVFGTEWYHGQDSRIYIHIYCYYVSPCLYCCVTTSWWVGGSLREFTAVLRTAVLLYYAMLYCCTTAVLLLYLLLYCCCTGLWMGRSVLSCRVLLSCPHGFVGFFFFFSLALHRPRAGLVQRTTIILVM